uniref:Choline transporter-like protein n=1 Tax=Hadrurus spadix TaxID=141984 RepID=A0A1W7RAS8_9SCOR
MSSQTNIPDYSKYGEPKKFDPNFSGPIKNRSCTDVLCLLIFVIFLIGWAVLAGYGFKYGDPDTLIDPTDSHGDVCGRGKHKDRKFLYFFNLLECIKFTSVLSGCPTPQVCVHHCPNETFSVYSALLTKTSENELKEKLICKYEADKKKSVRELVDDEDCAWLYLESENLIGRCVPKFVTAGFQQTSNIIDSAGKQISNKTIIKAKSYLQKLSSAKELGSKIFQDIKAVWKSILIGLLISLVVAFLWIFLMRWLAGMMVFVSILIVFGLLGFLSYYSYTRYKLDEKDLPKISSQVVNKKSWLALMVITIIIMAILLLVLIFLRNRIRIAVALIKEGSVAVGCMMSALIFPLMPYLLHLIVFVFWGAAAVYLAAMRKKRYVQTTADNSTAVCDPLEMNTTIGELQCRFDSYVNDHMVYMQLYNLAGLFWGTFFVMGFGQIVLAGAFASYYWTFNKPSDVPTFAVAQSICRSTRYHLGSVAFGALLITIVRLIRVLLEYIEMKCKKYENTFTKVIMCLCKCCFWCLERFIKFINKNAYIMIAVYGKNFCTSAKDAFSLLMRNIVRVVVLDKVTDFLLFIGKLVVVGATAAASFYFFTGRVTLFGHRTPELNYYIVPVAIITLGSYIISTSFFNVYSMGVDTLFLCFLEDCERNDGSTERPYYMSKQLMVILGKKNVEEPK